MMASRNRSLSIISCTLLSPHNLLSSRGIELISFPHFWRIPSGIKKNAGIYRAFFMGVISPFSRFNMIGISNYPS